MSLVSPALAGRLFTNFATWENPQELRTEDRAVKNQAPNITSSGAYTVLGEQKKIRKQPKPQYIKPKKKSCLIRGIEVLVLGKQYNFIYDG